VITLAAKCYNLTRKTSRRLLISSASGWAFTLSIALSRLSMRSYGYVKLRDGFSVL